MKGISFLSSKMTGLLAVLLVCALAAALMALSRMQRVCANAQASQRDLASCLHDLSEMPGSVSPSDGSAAGIDDPELNRQLRSAAAVASITDEVASIEPGQARRVRDTDYTETLVFVRLNAVSMEQLITFLHTLSQRDTSVRAKSIELSPPPDGAETRFHGTTRPSQNAELWSADVALACTAYSPHPGTDH